MSPARVLPDRRGHCGAQPFGKSLLGLDERPRRVRPSVEHDRRRHVDAHIPAVGTSGARSAPPAAIITGGAVVVVWQSTVRAFHATSGEQLWKSTPQEGSSLLALLTPAAPSTAATTTAGGASGGLVVPAVHVYGLSKDGDLITAVLEDSGERSSKGGAGGRSTQRAVRTLYRGYKGNGLCSSLSIVRTLRRSTPPAPVCCFTRWACRLQDARDPDAVGARERHDGCSRPTPPSLHAHPRSPTAALPARTQGGCALTGGDVRWPPAPPRMPSC